MTIVRVPYHPRLRVLLRDDDEDGALRRHVSRGRSGARRARPHKATGIMMGRQWYVMEVRGPSLTTFQRSDVRFWGDSEKVSCEICGGERMHYTSILAHEKTRKGGTCAGSAAGGDCGSVLGERLATLSALFGASAQSVYERTRSSWITPNCDSCHEPMEVCPPRNVVELLRRSVAAPEQAILKRATP